MFRDLQRHQFYTSSLSASSGSNLNANLSSSGDITNVGPQFLSCNPRYQSFPIPTLGSRLAGATFSLNSLAEVESFRLLDFWHRDIRQYFQTAKILFNYANDMDEVTKYTKLLNLLQKNHTVFPKITDILKNIPHYCFYSCLNASLLEIFPVSRVTPSLLFCSLADVMTI